MGRVVQTPDQGMELIPRERWPLPQSLSEAARDRRQDRMERTHPLRCRASRCPQEQHMHLPAASSGRWEQVHFTRCLDMKQARPWGWASPINCTDLGLARKVRAPSCSSRLRHVWAVYTFTCKFGNEVPPQHSPTHAHMCVHARKRILEMFPGTFTQ